MSSSSTASTAALSFTNARSPVRQLSVFLHNQVGALLSLVRLLKDESIEVLGLSLVDSTELTLVRLVVTDPDSAKDLFESHGHACVSKTIVAVELAEGAHDLQHVLAALLSAEINVQHSYPLMTRPGGKPVLALYLDDAETGEEALHKTGFKTLTQSDLSR